MLRELVRHRHLMQRPAAIAGLVASVSFLGGAAVYWTESMAYANLPIDQLEMRVGTKGECCAPGLRTNCEDQPPFACTTEGIVCDDQSSFDTCADPSCEESDNDDDGCDAQGYETYSVTVTTCHVIAGGEVFCEEGGTHCMYTTGEATVDFTGCGVNSVCSVSAGPTCQ